jgi:hypothetical protein
MGIGGLASHIRVPPLLPEDNLRQPLMFREPRRVHCGLFMVEPAA